MEVGSSDFPNARTAMTSPLAKALFAIEGTSCLPTYCIHLIVLFYLSVQYTSLRNKQPVACCYLFILGPLGQVLYGHLKYP
jgi:hypothetical protein